MENITAGVGKRRAIGYVAITIIIGAVLVLGITNGTATADSGKPIIIAKKAKPVKAKKAKKAKNKKVVNAKAAIKKGPNPGSLLKILPDGSIDYYVERDQAVRILVARYQTAAKENEFLKKQVDDLFERLTNEKINLNVCQARK